MFVQTSQCLEDVSYIILNYGIMYALYTVSSVRSPTDLVLGFCELTDM